MKLKVKFNEQDRRFQTNFSEQNQSFNADMGEIHILHDGQNGATFTPSVSDEGVISWTNDRELPNPTPVNIKGGNGADGKDGYTPIKGVDYFDGKDGSPGKDGYTPIKGKDYFDGAPGAAGYTPIKGVDYFDGQPGKDGVDGKDGYTPIKGVDYFDGKDGADGQTPVKGTDYFTEEDKQEMVDAVVAQIPSDDGGVSDVQLNGATIVDENGIATIPVVTAAKGGYGIVRVGNLANGNMGVRNSNGAIMLCYPEASINGFKQRKSQGSQYSGVVGSSNFDLAVKVAMTDGVGAEWTEEEQAAARSRMGAVSLEEVLAAIPSAEGVGF